MAFKNPKKTKQLRRELRRNMTETEELLWKRLRNKQLCGLKVRRQYGMGPYVLDFYVPEVYLAIEVDGKIHLKKEQIQRDLNKDTFLENHRVDVIRIKNEEVISDIDRVIDRLENMVYNKLKI
ncbi:MAG: endonuclease domain-containing protein [Balneolaceae bacterium]|nr:endonuclease domain-containing protein [Balneolaceae bacterium]